VIANSPECQELPRFLLLPGVSVVRRGRSEILGRRVLRGAFFKDLKPAEELAAKAARDAYEMLDPRPVKTQKAAVIFHADVGSALLGGILGAGQRRTGSAGSELPGKNDGPEDRLGTHHAYRRRDAREGRRQRALRRRGGFDPEKAYRRKRRAQGLHVQYHHRQARRSQKHGNASRAASPACLRSVPPVLSGRRPGQARRYHQGNQSRPSGQGSDRLRHQPGQREFQRRGFRLLDRRRENRLPGQGLTIAGTADEMLNGIDSWPTTSTSAAGWRRRRSGSTSSRSRGMIIIGPGGARGFGR